MAFGYPGRDARTRLRSAPCQTAPMDGTFTSELAEELAEPLLDRFTRYVRVDTQSDRAHALDRVPVSDNQLELARLLVEDLRQAGLEDAALDEQRRTSRPRCPAMRRIPPTRSGDRADRAHGHEP